ncbi:MAG: TonB-dependent receptor [bacterium]|nr:MAG: TonB-dependent receptor [bacterium]
MKGILRFSMIMSLSVIVLLLLLTFGRAGTTGKISGRISDASTGEPLIGVNIYIEGYPYGSASDIDGFFYILNIPPGEYTLVAQMLNYREQRVNDVEVNIDLTTRLDLKMAPEALDLGEEITVVAERPLIQKDVTSTSVTISTEDFKSLPVENFNEIVNLQAGVIDGHFRGGRSGEVAYLVDGIPVKDQYNNEVAVEIENTSIQQLEVISGTFNAEYGQAMSAVVNMVTKEGGNKFDYDLSGYVGNYFTNNSDIFPNLGIDNGGRSENVQATVSGPLPLFNKLKFFATGRYFRSDGRYYGRRLYKIDDNFPFTPSGDGTYVRMDPFKKYSLQGKLTYYFIPSMKVNYTFFWDDNENRDYDHGYRLAPDGIKSHFNSNLHHNLILNHTLSNSTFQTLKGAYSRSIYTGYVFEDPFAEGYVIPELGNPQSGYTFRTGGNQSDRYNRDLITMIGKYDLVSQITKEHKITLGAEYRIHDLSQFYTAFRASPNASPDDETKYDIVYPEENAPGWESYTREPFEFNIYLQDKMEYEDFIVNFGVRYDYFDPNTKIPSNPRNPQYNPLFPSGEKKADRKQQVSPRFSVAFPISASGVIYGSYGHFFQVPNFDQLYRNIVDLPDGRTTFQIGSETGETGEFETVVGNPDLKSESTVKYELGLQQVLYSDLVMYVTAYYSDIRNWVQVELIETYDTRKYARFINRDYANVTGLILSLEKRFSGLWGANLDYTYQIAKGNASDPQDALNRERNNEEPEKTLIPLDWDQRHTLNFAVNTGKPGNWNLGLIGRYGSGTPYTADRFFNPVDITFRNDRRKPAFLTFDARFEKFFNIGKVKLSTFFFVYNIFDRLNEVNVYGSSGRAAVDYNTQFAGDVIGLHTIDAYVNNPTFYSAPREIRVGLRITY